jgi:hypothetical protein
MHGKWRPRLGWMKNVFVITINEEYMKFRQKLKESIRNIYSKKIIEKMLIIKGFNCVKNDQKLI